MPRSVALALNALRGGRVPALDRDPAAGRATLEKRLPSSAVSGRGEPRPPSARDAGRGRLPRCRDAATGSRALRKRAESAGGKAPYDGEPHGSRGPLLLARAAAPGGDREGARRDRLRRARDRKRRALHLLRRRPGRAVPAGPALRALVPARRPAPPAARRARQEAPARALRARGLLVRAGRRSPSPFWRGRVRARGGGPARAAWKALGSRRRAAYVGDEPERAAAAGLARQPGGARRAARLGCAATRTPYEVAASRRRPRRGAAGHRAAREAFAARRLASSRSTRPSSRPPAASTTSCPTTRSSRSTRRARRCTTSEAHERAAARCCCSTRARSYAATAATSRARRPRKAATPLFRELVARVDALQQELVRAATPGPPYLDVHLQAHRGVAAAAPTCGVLRVSAEEAVAKGSRTPSSRTASATSSASRCTTWRARRPTARARRRRRRKEHPYLRTTRTIEAGPRLHDRARDLLHRDAAAPAPLGPDAQAFDWPPIDALAPLGGVRVEDNVLVTAGGPRNLTREQLAD